MGYTRTGTIRNVVARTASDEHLSLQKRLGEEIRRARGGRTQQELADAIGADQTTLSDYENARSRVPLVAVVSIEDALGLDRGDLLREAGYAPAVDAANAEYAIKHDPRLDEEGRRNVLSFYRYVRDQHPRRGDRR